MNPNLRKALCIMPDDIPVPEEVNAEPREYSKANGTDEQWKVKQAHPSGIFITDTVSSGYDAGRLA